MLARLLLTLIITSLIIPAQTYAQGWVNIPACNSEDNQYQGPPVIDGVATFRGIECIFVIILNYAITFIGIAILIMVVVGAFRILTSGGDPKGVEAGRSAITMAILGLVAAIASWLILNLIANITGATSILNFKLFNGV